MWYKCKKKGHKAANYKHSESGVDGGGRCRGGGRGKFTGTCKRCEKVGHKKSDFWELEENASKSPNNCKVTGETEPAAIEHFLTDTDGLRDETKESKRSDEDEDTESDEKECSDSDDDGMPPTYSKDT